MSKNSVSTVAVLLAALWSPSVPEKIRAAEATKISILFEGHRVFTTDQLRSAMLLGGPASAIRGSITEELQQRLQRVREFLIAKGYVTARLGTPQRAQGPNSLEVFRVAVEEGPLYRLGEVKLTGVTVFSEAEILGALDLKQGDTFKGDAVRVWFERLKDMYANAGYLDWTPIPRQAIKEPESASSEGTVNLTIDMDEGSRL